MENMFVSEIKAKKVFAGPGQNAYVAESVVYDDDTGDAVYVTVQEYDGLELTVAEKSVYAFLAEDSGEPVSEFLEEYETVRESRKSEYAGVFDKLRSVIAMLG